MGAPKEFLGDVLLTSQACASLSLTCKDWRDLCYHKLQHEDNGALGTRFTMLAPPSPSHPATDHPAHLRRASTTSQPSSDPPRQHATMAPPFDHLQVYHQDRQYSERKIDYRRQYPSKPWRFSDGISQSLVCEDCISRQFDRALNRPRTGATRSWIIATSLLCSRQITSIDTSQITQKSLTAAGTTGLKL